MRSQERRQRLQRRHTFFAPLSSVLFPVVLPFFFSCCPFCFLPLFSCYHRHRRQDRRRDQGPAAVFPPCFFCLDIMDPRAVVWTWGQHMRSQGRRQRLQRRLLLSFPLSLSPSFPFLPFHLPCLFPSFFPASSRDRRQDCSREV